MVTEGAEHCCLATRLALAKPSTKGPQACLNDRAHGTLPIQECCHVTKLSCAAGVSWLPGLPQQVLQALGEVLRHDCFNRLLAACLAQPGGWVGGRVGGWVGGWVGS